MNREFFKNMAVRAVKTFCQTLVGGITVGSALNEVDWVTIASVAAVAALMSVLTSLASLDTISESGNEDEEGEG